MLGALPGSVRAHIAARAAVLALSATTATLAQSPNRTGTAPTTGSNAVGQPEVIISRTAAPPVIDGHLDDPMWDTALRIDRFTQSSPTEGGAPTERTEVWIAYDENQLYFGFHAHYSNPTIIRANRVDRDRAGRDDWIAVMVDPFRDQQRAYRFSVNGYGVQGDAILNAGGSTRGPPGGGGDTTWNALFDSAGQLVADGWTAELAIPFKSLRYPTRPAGQPHQWGFQITRTIQTKDETLVWAPYTRNITGLLRQMGLLVGMDDLSLSRNIELLPTVTAIQYGELDRATGQFANASPTPDIGLNLKYGVTSNLTADFTANPDYSQIESDQPQIEVNQRFPLFFPELRPFFLEGQEIFTTPGPLNLVHTRTIVDPRVGGKLTGKVGRTTLGVLVADDEAPGKRGDPDGDAFGRTAQFFIGRARYDLYSESHIGAIVTDREFIDSYSRVAGVDGRLQVGRSHGVEFNAVTSANRDEDGMETSGPAFDVRLARDSRRLDYGVRYHRIDPEFDTAAGFIRRVDMRRTDANLSYRWWPEAAVISWGPDVDYSLNHDHRGVRQDQDYRVGLTSRFARNSSARASVRRQLERFRGVDFYKTRYSINGSFNADRRYGVSAGTNWGDQIRFIDNPFLGRTIAYTLQLTVLPTSRLRVNLALDTTHFTDPRTETRAFDVKIARSFTTYQFTNRLLVRSINEYNSFRGTFGTNVLITYRVNAGTVFFIGYDDHLAEGREFDEERFLTRALVRTNRAFFAKFQYLFRY